MQKYFIHADDLGLTKGITDHIVDCIDHGAVNSASIIPNGHAFDYAIEEYAKRKNFRLVVHLNLHEGKPLSRADQVPLLVGEDGVFNTSFQSILIDFVRGNADFRRELKAQVKQEVQAQLEKVVHAAGNDYQLKVDSHLHYHMLPFVFETIMELHEDQPLAYLRISREPWFWNINGLADAMNYASINIVKHRMLNYLANKYRYIEQLQSRGISTCDYFVGMLFTGKMSADVTASALRKIKKLGQTDPVIELLFHPGAAEHGEEHHWEQYPGLEAYYFSSARKVEADNLKNTYMLQLKN
jgi:predicted glycoside hydrolase/deacetylase ChbG (UPF0249 family)